MGLRPAAGPACRWAAPGPEALWAVAPGATVSSLCDRGGIRTPDLVVRSHLLYPTELPGQCVSILSELERICRNHSQLCAPTREGVAKARALRERVAFAVLHTHRLSVRNDALA